MFKRLENFHSTLFWVLLSLVGVGLVNLYSALDLWGEMGLDRLFWSQLVWVIIGFGIFFLLLLVDYRFWERFCWGFYIFSLLLLLAVLLFGSVRGGHKSWLGVGVFSFQPTELAKFSLIILLAKYFSDHPQPDGYSFPELFLPALLMLGPFLLVIVQKDLGSSLFFPLIFGTMAWLARIRRRTILFAFCLMLAGFVGAYRYGLSGYQQDRIKTFLDPSRDVRGSGYHLLQSKIAVGSGKIFGRGYLKGKINKLRYLPEKHTDFVFPVLAEEWGFVGGLVVLGLFSTFLIMGLQVALRARERFGSFLVFGVVALLFWQIVINLGGVLGMIPMTGVTLPFLSYGGSSTVVTLAAVGLIFNVHMRRFMF